MISKEAILAFINSPSFSVLSPLVILYLLLNPIIEPISAIPGKLDLLNQNIQQCVDKHIANR